MDHFGHMISKTPSWVWIILVLMVIHGVRAFKDRTTPLAKVAIPPFLFTAFSIYTVHEAFKPSGLVYGVWTIAWVAGIVAAITVFKGTPPKVADKERKILMLPGSARVLILCLLIFGSRYILAYGIAFDPELLTDTVPEMILLGVTAGCSGFFIGKLISCIRALNDPAA